jgi:Flp pilus assembly protein TadG
MRKITTILKSEKGNTLPLMAAVILLMIALAGIIIDTGLVIEAKLQLHSATKAAANASRKAYDQTIWDKEKKVVLIQGTMEAYANEYLHYNLPKAKLVDVTIFNNYSTDVSGEIKTKYKVDLIFMKIFGIDECEVKTSFNVFVNAN